MEVQSRGRGPGVLFAHTSRSLRVCAERRVTRPRTGRRACTTSRSAGARSAPGFARALLVPVEGNADYLLKDVSFQVVDRPEVRLLERSRRSCRAMWGLGLVESPSAHGVEPAGHRLDRVRSTGEPVDCHWTCGARRGEVSGTGQVHASCRGDGRVMLQETSAVASAGSHHWVVAHGIRGATWRGRRVDRSRGSPAGTAAGPPSSSESPAIPCAVSGDRQLRGCLPASSAQGRRRGPRVSAVDHAGQGVPDRRGVSRIAFFLEPSHQRLPRSVVVVPTRIPTSSCRRAKSGSSRPTRSPGREGRSPSPSSSPRFGVAATAA